jgi:hypothetical protein
MKAEPITKTFNTPEKMSLYTNPNPPSSDADPSLPSQEKLQSKSKEDSSLNYPSFSQYINPQRLKPYDEMLKKI